MPKRQVRPPQSRLGSHVRAGATTLPFGRFASLRGPRQALAGRRHAPRRDARSGAAASQDDAGHQHRDGPGEELGQVGRIGSWQRVLPPDFSALQHPVPRGVRDQRREDDDACPLGHHAEQQRKQRHQHHQHRDLAELDADVEGEQRRDEVRAGELQRFAQREREAEAVHQAERERHHPAPVRAGADDVLERHVDDRRGDQASPPAAGTTGPAAPSPNADASSVIECATVNAVAISTSGRSRRNGITRQARNSRWSVPSRMCHEAGLHEAPAPPGASAGRGGRGPGSPCSSKARSAPVARQEAQRQSPPAGPGARSAARPRSATAPRRSAPAAARRAAAGSSRAARSAASRGAGQVRERAVVVRERAVRRQRDARLRRCAGRGSGCPSSKQREVVERARRPRPRAAPARRAPDR